MKTFSSFMRAFGRAYTYDARRNSYLWLGVFWGLLIPFFTISFDLSLQIPERRGLIEVLRAHPTYVVLLTHPLVLGILFGAMGTVRHDLEAENERMIRTLQELAMTDPLTGLYNRRYVREALKNMLDSARRIVKPLSVILIDLDGFKAVNDQYGHPRGDRVLCDATAALRSSLRQSDVLGRHGGDEFILLTAADRLSATRLLERAVAAVRAGTGLALCAGIACWPEDGQTPEELIAAADGRLGEFKRRSQDSRILPAVRAPREAAP